MKYELERINRINDLIKKSLEQYKRNHPSKDSINWILVDQLVSRMINNEIDYLINNPKDYYEIYIK